MGINNRLYDRGHEGYDKSIGSKLLYVDGILPDSQRNDAYEGRLQIHNAVGACSVEILSSENLPDGASVYVDNTTSQIVIAWPAKNIPPIQLINPGFETGDLTGWSYETKGGSGTLVTSTNYKDVGVYSAYWAGGKGLGSEGGIECLAVNDARGPVNPGDMVTAKLRVMYNPGGGTPKGSRGQVRLQWYDASDNLLKVSEGFLIKTRAYNGKWTDTVVSDRAVPNSAYVKFAGWVTATGAGHTYFDSAEWDLPPYVGTDIPQTITLWLRVHDASGRAADWHGDIVVGDFYGTRWRINITRSTPYNDASFTRIAELQMRETADGPNECTGGVASASSERSPALNAFDGNNNTDWQALGDPEAGVVNLQYDFGRSLWITQVTLLPSQSFGNRPTAFSIDRSNDGIEWHTVKSFDILTWPDADKAARVFTL